MDGFENDRRSLRGKAAVDRREMLTASLAAGFAVAVRPVAAQTVDPYRQRRPRSWPSERSGRR